MYQAWLVQEFNGVPYNVVLGKHFETVEEAQDAIDLFEQVFGKCSRVVIEKAGTPIPTAERKRESLFDLFKKWFS